MKRLLHFAFFDTKLGRCAIVWGDRGVRAILLPEADEAATRERLIGRHPEAVESEPTGGIARAIAALVASVDGLPASLDLIILDYAGVPPFHRRVYEAARHLGPGATISYGELAERVGAPGAARAVGQAMARNPFPLVVPCHRVVAAGGKPGGFSAHGGVTTKLWLLRAESEAAGFQLTAKR